MKSKYFKIYELVPKELYDLIKEDELWNLFDDKLLYTIDSIKEKFNKGTMTINSWHWDGYRNQSGLRTKNSKLYSEGSQHSIGKATDSIFSDYNTEEVRQYIIKNPKEFPYIKGIELGVSWLHTDVRDSNNVILFRK